MCAHHYTAKKKKEKNRFFFSLESRPPMKLEDDPLQSFGIKKKNDSPKYKLSTNSIIDLINNDFTLKLKRNN